MARIEAALVAIKERRILEKITYGIGGLRAKMGGLVTNSGFAVGPEFTVNVNNIYQIEILISEIPGVGAAYYFLVSGNGWEHQALRYEGSAQSTGILEAM